MTSRALPVGTVPENVRAVSFAHTPIRVCLDGVVDDTMMTNARACFNQVRRGRQPVVVVEINSYGGSVDSGELIVMMMDQCKRENIIVCTYVPVHAESMGAYIFSCGTPQFRFIGPDACIMIHEARRTSVSTRTVKASDHAVDARSLAATSSRLLKKMSRNAGHGESYFDDMLVANRNVDLELIGQQAVETNIADRVVTSVPNASVHISLAFRFGNLEFRTDDGRDYGITTEESQQRRCTDSHRLVGPEYNT